MSFLPLFGVAQGIYTGQVEKQLVDAWNWVTHFKNAVYPAAFQVLSWYSYFCSATELLYLVNAFLWACVTRLYLVFRMVVWLDCFFPDFVLAENSLSFSPTNLSQSLFWDLDPKA